MQPDYENPQLHLNRTESLLGQVHIAVIRLDDKVDNLSSLVERMSKDFTAKHEDHEKRIRDLEKQPYVSPATVWRVIGALTSLAAIGLTIIGFVIK